MKAALKRVLSKHVIGIVLVILLSMTSLNTYLILEGIEQANRTGAVGYDYVLSQEGSNYLLKNTRTGHVSSQAQSASIPLNTALSEENQFS
jgi:hypothetical protein